MIIIQTRSGLKGINVPRIAVDKSCRQAMQMMVGPCKPAVSQMNASYKVGELMQLSRSTSF